MCSDEAIPEQAATKAPEGGASASGEGVLESELQRQLYLFHNRILNEIRHEGRIVQGELRRNRLLMTDEIERARDCLHAVISDLALRLLRRINVAVIAGVGIVSILALSRYL